MDVEPRTHAEIVRALAEAEDEVASFFGGLSASDFLYRQGEAWTPAEQLRHLTRSVRAVGRAFSLPAWLLLVRFGWRRGASRTFAEVRETYRAALAAGGRATGEYVPPREEVRAEETAAYQRGLVERWRAASADLRRGVERWGEGPLDRVRLPHPLIGYLSAREMLFFTLYHDLHHVRAAAGRLPGVTPR
ncbi:MAG TPA: DinB family protein [Longimicrobium sp.]|nr:DinB family protein [Longimicrobium sp.]